jgi:hypothetical protein
MGDTFHFGTFVWGVVLTIVGAALAAVGFGWWDLSAIDLRYVAPVFVILVGGVILLGALTSQNRDST